MTATDFDLRPNPRPHSDAERLKVLESPGFGRFFTDHMVSIRYVEGQGWLRGALEAYAPITLDPAASVLHYGQAIFEGFKAYRADGGIVTFRPDANARRFARSAERLAMPPLPVETFIAAADALIARDAAWVPTAPDTSLYLRPLMIATEGVLGVRPAHEYLFLLFASPAGAYFSGGVKPVSVWISEDYVRAAPGGTGTAKCAGNYAASLVAQRDALAKGCDQVVWIDAVERKWIEEMGGMNVMFVYEEGGKPSLVTPDLSSGTLLPGVTRDSLLTLARDRGWRATERRVSVDELTADIASGKLKEAFACGTAAVITPIGLVKSARGAWTIADGQPGKVTMDLRHQLLELQHGRAPDPHGWVHRVG
ncbi:MAG: branched-chain amino acid aminotransferase [Polyangiaceae bacterium]|nr:branched-chain amino acid aminotransferase [Polyangiaceae bacterium]